jgi:DNA-binding transcriptional ArsR family regulator
MHDELFRVLAEPRRREIVEALRTRELAVNAIVDAVGIHQSGVSRHLGILLASGFVQVRAEGSQRLYALRAERFRELATWLGRYRSMWERREVRRRDRRIKARGRA